MAFFGLFPLEKISLSSNVFLVLVTSLLNLGVLFAGEMTCVSVDGPCQFTASKAVPDELYTQFWAFIDPLHESFVFSKVSGLTTANTKIRFRNNVINFYTTLKNCKGADPSQPISCMEKWKKFLEQNDVHDTPNPRAVYKLKFVVFEVIQNGAREKTIGLSTRISGGEEVTGGEISGLGVNSAISHVAGSINPNDLLLNLTFGKWNQSIVYGTDFFVDVYLGLSSAHTFNSQDIYAVTDGRLDDKTKLSVSDSFNGTLLVDPVDPSKLWMENFRFQTFIPNSETRQVTKTSTPLGFSTTEFGTIGSYIAGQYHYSRSARLPLIVGLPSYVMSVRNISKGSERGKSFTGYSKVNGESKRHLLVMVTVYPVEGPSTKSFQSVMTGSQLTEETQFPKSPFDDSKRGSSMGNSPVESADRPELLAPLKNEDVIQFSPFMEVGLNVGGFVAKNYIFKLNPDQITSENQSVMIKLTIETSGASGTRYLTTQSMASLAYQGFRFGFVPPSETNGPVRSRFIVKATIDEEYFQFLGLEMPPFNELSYEVLHEIGPDTQNKIDSTFMTRILEP